MESAEGKQIQCYQCQRSFSHLRGLLRHKKSAHASAPPKMLHCRQCQYSDRRRDNLRRHYRQVHRDHLPEVESLKYEAKSSEANRPPTDVRQVTANDETKVETQRSQEAKDGGTIIGATMQDACASLTSPEDPTASICRRRRCRQAPVGRRRRHLEHWRVDASTGTGHQRRGEGGMPSLPRSRPRERMPKMLPSPG